MFKYTLLNESQTTHRTSIIKLKNLYLNYLMLSFNYINCPSLCRETLSGVVYPVNVELF